MTIMCSDIGNWDTDDGARARPLRVGVALGELVLWDNDVPAERIRGIDLSDIARQSAGLRDDDPDVAVVADIDVYIDAEAEAVREMLKFFADEPAGSTMRYVGTPAGLVGLIADIHAVGIADGAVLIARAAGVADLIRDAVLPALATKLPTPSRAERTA